MGALIFYVILAVLFIVACLIGVVALYLALKGWAHDELNIELPPYKYCPWCGMRMEIII